MEPQRYDLLLLAIRNGQLSSRQVEEHLKDQVFREFYRRSLEPRTEYRLIDEPLFTFDVS